MKDRDCFLMSTSEKQNNENVYRKARIIDDAIIGCDIHLCKWSRNDNTIFDVHPFDYNRKKLIAYGYGEEGSSESYGNGALYVWENHIIYIDDVKTNDP